MTSIPIGFLFCSTHMKLMEQLYAGKKKSKEWLMSEHNRTFANWFESKVRYGTVIISSYLQSFISDNNEIYFMVLGGC